MVFYSEMVSIKLGNEDGNQKSTLSVSWKLLINSSLSAKLNPIFTLAKILPIPPYLCSFFSWEVKFTP